MRKVKIIKSSSQRVQGQEERVRSGTSGSFGKSSTTEMSSSTSRPLSDTKLVDLKVSSVPGLVSDKTLEISQLSSTENTLPGLIHKYKETDFKNFPEDKLNDEWFIIKALCARAEDYEFDSKQCLSALDKMPEFVKLMSGKCVSHAMEALVGIIFIEYRRDTDEHKIYLSDRARISFEEISTQDLHKSIVLIINEISETIEYYDYRYFSSKDIDLLGNILRECDTDTRDKLKAKVTGFVNEVKVFLNRELKDGALSNEGISDSLLALSELLSY